MSAQDDHKERIRHVLARIRTSVESVELGLQFNTLSADGAMAIATAATELAYYAARHDAEAPPAEGDFKHNPNPGGWRK